MLGYWFSLTPPAIAGGSAQLWGGIAIACIVVAVLLRRLVVRRFSQRFRQEPWQRLARLLTATGLLLLVLLFFRYEGVPFFGSRFWLPLLGLGDLAWLVAIIRSFSKVPAQRRAWEEEQRKRRYLR